VPSLCWFSGPIMSGLPCGRRICRHRQKVTCPRTCQLANYYHVTIEAEFAIGHCRHCCNIHNLPTLHNLPSGLLCSKGALPYVRLPSLTGSNGKNHMQRCRSQCCTAASDRAKQAAGSCPEGRCCASLLQHTFSGPVKQHCFSTCALP
jgi:hypothetical protein